jgi:hypothetical protein
MRLLSAPCVAAALTLGIPDAHAIPKKIIILRHGEKASSTALCATGAQRSLALVQDFLGADAKNSLFSKGEAPEAFFAITLHALELASPAATSWKLPVITYSVVPLPGANEVAELDARTGEAAQHVLTHPAYDGKIVVMVWEHDHIATTDSKKATVTLYSQFGLNKQGLNVPTAWEGQNYDYFWIIDFKDGAPDKFEMKQQAFSGAYKDLPTNKWGGKKEKKKKNPGCKL